MREVSTATNGHMEYKSGQSGLSRARSGLVEKTAFAQGMNERRVMRYAPSFLLLARGAEDIITPG